MNEEWRTPISKDKIIDRRNRLIEYQKTRDITFSSGYQIINENILSINYMIYEIERLNNIINELEKWLKFFNETGLVIDLEEGKQTTVMPTLAVIEKLQELKGSDKE